MKKNQRMSDNQKRRISETKKFLYKDGLIIPWNKGKRGVQIPWNKGKHNIYSEETKIKMSKSHKGKIPWNRGIPRTDEEKRKISNSERGKIISEEQKKIISKVNKNKIVSESTRNKMRGNNNPAKRLEVRKKLSAENHHNWKGGISFLPYCPKFNESKKEEIRNKYNRKCYICGNEEKNNITKTGKQRKLSIHHVDMDKEQGCNGKEWHLIPLCINCHGKVHGLKRTIGKL